MRFVTTRENFNIRLYVRQLENITKVEQNVKWKWKFSLLRNKKWQWVSGYLETYYMKGSM